MRTVKEISDMMGISVRTPKQKQTKNTVRARRSSLCWQSKHFINNGRSDLRIMQFISDEHVLVDAGTAAAEADDSLYFKNALRKAVIEI